MPRRPLTIILTLLLTLPLFVACNGTEKVSYVFNGGEFSPAKDAPEIALTDQRGNPFSLQAETEAGKVVLLYFGYTTCPDACPTTLSDWISVREALGENADKVDFVMVTVDPERDTQQKLEKYLNFFDPSFLGLWGTTDQITPITQAYGIAVQRVDYPESKTKYLINHTTSTLVIDRDGKLRLSYAHGTDPNAIAEDLSQLI